MFRNTRFQSALLVVMETSILYKIKCMSWSECLDQHEVRKLLIFGKGNVVILNLFCE